MRRAQAANTLAHTAEEQACADAEGMRGRRGGEGNACGAESTERGAERW